MLCALLHIWVVAVILYLLALALQKNYLFITDTNITIT